VFQIGFASNQTTCEGHTTETDSRNFLWEKVQQARDQGQTTSQVTTLIGVKGNMARKQNKQVVEFQIEEWQAGKWGEVAGVRSKQEKEWQAKGCDEGLNLGSE
jgi:hypothetical protein